MPRTKTGTVRREGHKKVFALTKGFRMARNHLYKTASEASIHAGQYAYNGRKEKKQQFRVLWIGRINSALSGVVGGPNYSTFMHSLIAKKVKLNRKSLAALAVKLPEAFRSIVSFTDAK